MAAPEPAPEEEFVDADNLDAYIAQDLAGKSKNDMLETEETADAVALGPDEPQRGV